MRVFATGASGFIGSAVVPELIGAGHEVVGLARSDAAAATLAAAGATVRRGDLTDLDALRAGAAESDGVIHLAFVHDFSAYGDSLAIDLAAIGALTGELEGSDRPFVGTSGTLGLAAGRLATEDDHGTPGAGRADAEQLALGSAARGVRASVIRLAPTVHDVGDHGFIATLIGIARATGVSGYIGDGSNHWPAVHRQDAARLYRLALEGAAAGTILHGVGEEGIAIRTIADLIGERLGLPVTSIDPADAGAHFGWLAGFLGADVPTSSARTRTLLGWEPIHRGLLEDLEHGDYLTDPA